MIFHLRLVGENDAGKTTIFNLLRGLTVSSKEEIFKFSYKKFNQKSIVIKKALGSIANIFNLNWLLKEQYVILVIDSTKSKEILQKNPYLRKIIKEKQVQNRILYIANKQDLLGAKKPKEIEKTLGYATAGFSAFSPDAPEQLEEIITDFLKGIIQ